MKVTLLESSYPETLKNVWFVGKSHIITEIMGGEVTGFRSAFSTVWGYDPIHKKILLNITLNNIHVQQHPFLWILRALCNCNK